MPTHVALAKLIPHPKNSQLPPVDAATYTAMQEDIAAHGILHPITVNVRTWHIVMGHHRVQIAQELGWESIPADLIDVDDTEEERLMIADNILRRQIDKPMDKARLIRWLKELHGVKRGNNQFLGDASDKMAEATQNLGMSERTAYRLDALNDLISPLQAMVDDGSLPQTVGAGLARKFTPSEQQALFDAIGATGIAHVKTSDIQAAKKVPDTSALETQIAALESERDNLQDQLDTAEAAANEPDTSSSLWESLQCQLTEAEATRQAYADELARLKAQGPVERIVEKVVEVEKPVSDPAQAQRIAQLESDLAATQKKVEDLFQAGYKQADLKLLDDRRKEVEKRLTAAQAAFTQVTTRENDQTTYRALVGKFVQEALKRFHMTAGEWQRIAEHPRFSLNITLYHDVQALASQLETVATGLRLMALDPAALKKRQQQAAPIIDTTATVIHDTATDEQGGMLDVFVDDPEHSDSD
ncbi:MAG: ParB N-terminal domain-containing protein [Firmicutes bacterium]|jgi:ParB family chromosome partitioning protein|uniref:Chromosome partitioning protein ParB n=1 Tax=Sulfobacillus benefaciens TaxID=453960 RepID=A0A2T2WNN2_9FIRM|nr:ParB N-terminal domain-containing protein [Bacillota bacterium]PSR23836.1 MAG: chromosome partitioning protein ParB [Sulfobacillus benefaciens]